MPMHMTGRVVMNEDRRRTNSCRSACCLVDTLHRLLNQLLVDQQRSPSPNRVLQQVWAPVSVLAPVISRAPFAVLFFAALLIARAASLVSIRQRFELGVESPPPSVE